MAKAKKKSRRFYWKDFHEKKARAAKRGECCGLSWSEQWKLLGVGSAFALMGFFFSAMTPQLGKAAWLVMLTAAVAWFWHEAARAEYKPRLLSKAIVVGLFLMVFDFVVESTGGVMGLWTTQQSFLPVGYVPGEILLITTLGGAAWALHVPAKPSNAFVWANSILFAAGGAFGEFLLTKNALMTYGNGWMSVHVFAAYLITWLLMFLVHEKVFKNAQAC